jgi:hypothetical protein
MAKISNKKQEYMVQRASPILNISLSDYAYIQPVDPRRRPEISDSRLIQEDPRAMANLSETALHHEFSPGKYMPTYWMESEVQPVGVMRANEPEEL